MVRVFRGSVWTPGGPPPRAGGENKSGVGIAEGLVKSSLDFLDFLKAPYITLLVREFGAEECPADLNRQFFSNDTRPEAKDIHIIMLDSLMGRVGVVA